MQKLSSYIADEMDSILYDNKRGTATYNKNVYNNLEDSDAWRSANLKALSKGFYNYIDQSINEFKQQLQVSEGILTTPSGASSPLITDVKCSINNSVSSLEELENLLIDGVRGESITDTSNKLFQTLQQWLDKSWVVTCESSPGLDTVSGISSSSFTLFSQQAKPYLAEMNSIKPNTREQSHEIMCKYIVLGLNTNVIAPITTTGSLSSNIYTGITTCLWSFS